MAEVTMYELQDLIERCFEELEKNRFIMEEVRIDESMERRVKIIIDRKQVIDHIANTLIGELLEFEMIRRLAPMFRELRRLEKDCEVLDAREKKRINLGGLRVAPEG